MTKRNDLIPSDAIAIVPSDTTNLSLVGLYVGGTGNVTVQCASGVAVTFNAVPVGWQTDLQIMRVMSTGTTATLITGYLA